MDWDVRDVSEKGWQKVSKPNCTLLMKNSLALTCAIVPQWVFLSSSSIISPTWTCASIPQGVFLSSATSWLPSSFSIHLQVKYSTLLCYFSLLSGYRNVDNECRDTVNNEQDCLVLTYHSFVSCEKLGTTTFNFLRLWLIKYITTLPDW